jgi:histidine triad (HIT) family protein
VWQDGATTAFVAPKWWDANPGHVLVVPNEHAEHLYEISEPALAAVYATARRVAVALKHEYGCDGTSTRQHNEPGAGQDVWHFHVHVFPRYEGDNLYANDERTRWTTPEERAPYARRLSERLARP